VIDLAGEAVAFLRLVCVCVGAADGVRCRLSVWLTLRHVKHMRALVAPEIDHLHVEARVL